MKSLPQRIISAAAALIILIVVRHYFQTPGIVVLGFLLTIVGSYEFDRLAFSHLALPKKLRFWFLAVCIFLIFITLFSNWYVIPSWGILIGTYFVGALWLLRDKFENEKLLLTLSLSALGFFYCAMMPTFALDILTLPQGDVWFLLLICVVFLGDIFAYFGGIWFGNKKLMPSISPNKTRAGAWAGLLGSALAGLTIGYWGLKTVPMTYLLVLSLLSAVLAQNGDLFESLLKRVADMKDSGALMPGHGGVLDRLDGIYFAAPLIYTAALVFHS